MNEMTTRQQTGQTMDIATTKAAQEVQAAMVVAKKFPRDEQAATDKIMRACKRERLAEDAAYEYPRGGQLITGPSIRLAEELARNWGNIDFGLIELDRTYGSSSVMAYCWDLETNCRETVVFQVQHVRERRGGNKKLTDGRDIYELIANQGARRMRSCILGVIPGDISEAALEACDNTLIEGKEPLPERRKKLVDAFEQIGVSVQMLEERLGHRLDAVTIRQLVKLRRVYSSIRDGIGTVEEFFKRPPMRREEPAGGSKADRMAEQLNSQEPEPPEEQEPEEQPPEQLTVDVSQFLRAISKLNQIREVEQCRDDYLDAAESDEDKKRLNALADDRIESIRKSRGGKK